MLFKNMIGAVFYPDISKYHYMAVISIPWNLEINIFFVLHYHAIRILRHPITTQIAAPFL